MIILGSLIVFLVSEGKSSNLVFFDDTFTQVSKDGLPFVDVNGWKEVLAVWGTWNSSDSVFSPFISSTNGRGYMYLENVYGGINEIMVSIFKTHLGGIFTIPTGTPMSLGVYDLPLDTAYPWSNQVAMAVLTDPSWLAPVWNLSTSETRYSFTTQTQAVFGTFNYNNGNEKIGLTTPAIPEPSSLSLLVLGGVLMALRRRR